METPNKPFGYFPKAGANERGPVSPSIDCEDLKNKAKNFDHKKFMDLNILSTFVDNVFKSEANKQAVLKDLFPKGSKYRNEAVEAITNQNKEKLKNLIDRVLYQEEYDFYDNIGKQ